MILSVHCLVKKVFHSWDLAGKQKKKVIIYNIPTPTDLITNHWQQQQQQQQQQHFLNFYLSVYLSLTVVKQEATVPGHINQAQVWC